MERPAAAGASASETDTEVGREEPQTPGDDLLVVQQIINNWYGNVEASGSNFGMRNQAEARRSRTGPLLQAEVDEALDRYVRPAPFDHAVELLAQHHVVVLHGPSSIGKRTSAIALLHQCGLEGRPHGLSPALPLSALDDRILRRDHGYLMLDRRREQQSTETASYEVEELQRRLARTGAFLVVTSTTPTEAWRRFSVEWEAPEPSLLLRTLTSPRVLGPDVEERFLGCREPRRIIEFSARLEEAGDDPNAVEQILEALDSRAVRRWFDTEPRQDAVVLITAIAFLYGVPRRRFEPAFASLTEAVRVRQRQTLGGRGLGPISEEPDIRQSWMRQVDEIPLIERTPSGGLTFASDSYRAAVVSELFQRYDHVLWDAVRTWVKGLVRSDEDSSLSVALGIGLLAEVAPHDVVEGYLRPWAQGSPNERTIACFCVWFASMNDELGPLMLDLAIEWARKRRTAVTGITCLSGELGLRYPDEALRWLWLLFARSTHGEAAGVAIGELFRAAVSAQDGELRVPRFLLDQFKRAPISGRGTPQRAVLRLILGVLGTTARHRRLTVALLRARADAASTLGALWAVALVNRTTRANALLTLREVLWALNGSRDGLPVIARLGKAVLSDLPAHEIAQLERDLFGALIRRKNTDHDRARTIVDALLASSSAQHSSRQEVISTQ